MLIRSERSKPRVRYTQTVLHHIVPARYFGLSKLEVIMNNFMTKQPIEGHGLRVAIVEPFGAR